MAQAENRKGDGYVPVALPDLRSAALTANRNDM